MTTCLDTHPNVNAPGDTSPTLAGMGRSVDVDDLIDSRAVAELLGLAHAESVHTIRRRHADFPEPAVDMGAGRCMLWVRGDVEAWAQQRRNG